MEEIWKNIRGYEEKYQVSNTGKVKSLNYNNTGKSQELKQKINRYGFCEVKLSKNNKTKDFMVGRLVAEAFIPNPTMKDEVMHINSSTDNSVNNLMWAYKSEVNHNTYNKGSRKGQPTYTKISYEGKNYTRYVDIAKAKGVNTSMFNKRIARGWGLYEALEIPVAITKKG